MFSFMKLLALSATAAAMASSAAASPLEKRDVFIPPVTYPHAGTVWYSGQTHNVTWYVYICAPSRAGYSL